MSVRFNGHEGQRCQRGIITRIDDAFRLRPVSFPQLGRSESNLRYGSARVGLGRGCLGGNRARAINDVVHVGNRAPIKAEPKRWLLTTTGRPWAEMSNCEPPSV